MRKYERTGKAATSPAWMYEYCSGIPMVGSTKTMKTYVRTAISRIVILIGYLPIASLASYHYNNVIAGETLGWHARMHGMPSSARVWFGLVGAEAKFTHLEAQESIRLSPSWTGSKEACGLVGTLIVWTNCRQKTTNKLWVKLGCRTAI